jgi:hypothetical protein
MCNVRHALTSMHCWLSNCRVFHSIVLPSTEKDKHKSDQHRTIEQRSTHCLNKVTLLTEKTCVARALLRISSNCRDSPNLTLAIGQVGSSVMSGLKTHFAFASLCCNQRKSHMQENEQWLSDTYCSQKVRKSQCMLTAGESIRL